VKQSDRLGRAALFARDGGCCVYCGQLFPPEELTVDHVEPRVRGGDHSGGNVVSACIACNLRKGHRRLADFLAEEPEARRNFFRLARYVWPRHRRAVAEALEKRGIVVDD
jgi:5-methylcytosine-specific restriction endonuclease McrA